MKRWNKPGAATAASLIAAGVITIFSPDLDRMLSRWEGEGQNIVYADKLAKGLPTVCRGLTKHTVDEPIIVGDFWSAEKCAEIEKKVTEGDQLLVATCLPDTISQKAFDAVSDMAHHMGTPSTCASRAVGLMWEGRWEEACDAFAHAPSGKPVWSYAGGKFYKGLYNRALDRRQMCLDGLK